MEPTQPLVLIVDDESDLLDTYKTKLERSGFRVLSAANGEEGIAVATKEHPDLILMDVKMPVMDGVTAQQKLQENPDTKNIKVVFLTAFSDPAHPEIDQAMAKGSGAIDFLKKGISLDELVEKVKGYLGIDVSK
jgi:CheY-like chemotaxis protein